MNMQVLDTRRDVSGGWKVDVNRGERIGRVSSEWFSRPDDERYLSLSDLYAAVRARADRATARTVESRAIRVEASRDDAERLALIVPGPRRAHRSDALVVRPDVQPRWRTRHLSAEPARGIGRHLLRCARPGLNSSLLPTHLVLPSGNLFSRWPVCPRHQWLPSAPATGRDG